MVLPDVNRLLHAHDTASPAHPAAPAWWDGLPGRNEGVGLAWATVLGFLQLAKRRKVFSHSMTSDEVLERVAEWMQLPHFHLVREGDKHPETQRALLVATGTAGNLTTSATSPPSRSPWATPSIPVTPTSPASRASSGKTRSAESGARWECVARRQDEVD